MITLSAFPQKLGTIQKIFALSLHRELEVIPSAIRQEKEIKIPRSERKKQICPYLHMT